MIMQVSDIMTPDPTCCTPDTPLQEVAQMMVDFDCGEIPVLENLDTKIPVGVVTDRDITCRTVAIGLNPLEKAASDCMTPNPVSIKPDASLEECGLLMEEHKIRRILVVDDAGACCGIVALADIASNASKGDAGDVLQEVSEANSSSAASGQ
jgi:CBS domain-containing protein